MSKTIMCVDDEANLLKLYEHELGEEGYQVIAAADGNTALAALASNEIDLVVLDIRMGEFDGLQVLGEIRKNNPDLPVLLHSAYSTYKHDFQSWLANDYLVKSADLAELKAKIRELLSI
ncbi:MAG: response regulator [candidate division Zixibacteria bacterium]|nr:response regulator [candidate division Zixibacteria bacterium]